MAKSINFQNAILGQCGITDISQLPVSQGAIAYAPIDWRLCLPNPIVALLRYCMDADDKIERWSGKIHGGLVYEYPRAMPRVFPEITEFREVSEGTWFIDTIKHWNFYKWLYNENDVKRLITLPFKLPEPCEDYCSFFMIYERPKSYLEDFEWTEFSDRGTIFSEIGIRLFGRDLMSLYFRNPNDLAKVDKSNMLILYDEIKKHTSFIKTVLAWCKMCYTCNIEQKEGSGEYISFFPWELDMMSPPTTIRWFTALFFSSKLTLDGDELFNEQVARDRIMSEETIPIQDVTQFYNHTGEKKTFFLTIRLTRPELATAFRIMECDPWESVYIAVFQFMFLAPYAYRSFENATKFRTDNKVRNWLVSMIGLATGNNSGDIENLCKGASIQPRKDNIHTIFQAFREKLKKKQVCKYFLPALFPTSDTWFKRNNYPKTIKLVDTKTRALCFYSYYDENRFPSRIAGLEDFALAGVILRVETHHVFVSVNEKGEKISLDSRGSNVVEGREMYALYLRLNSSYESS